MTIEMQNSGVPDGHKVRLFDVAKVEISDDWHIVRLSESVRTTLLSANKEKMFFPDRGTIVKSNKYEVGTKVMFVDDRREPTPLFDDGVLIVKDSDIILTQKD